MGATNSVKKLRARTGTRVRDHISAAVRGGGPSYFKTAFHFSSSLLIYLTNIFLVCKYLSFPVSQKYYPFLVIYPVEIR